MAWHYCPIIHCLIIKKYFLKKWKESVYTDKYKNFMKQALNTNLQLQLQFKKFCYKNYFKILRFKKFLF